MFWYERLLPAHELPTPPQVTVHSIWLIVRFKRPDRYFRPLPTCSKVPVLTSGKKLPFRRSRLPGSGPGHGHQLPNREHLILSNFKKITQLSVVHHLASAFEQASSYSQYHPSRGYSWKFPTDPAHSATSSKTDKNGMPTRIRQHY